MPASVIDAALAALLAPLEIAMADPQVTEILVNGPEAVWVERLGELERLPVQLVAGALPAVARVVASASAMATLDTEACVEGSWRAWRMTLVLPPVARPWPCLAMRRHRELALPLAAWRFVPMPPASAPECAPVPGPPSLAAALVAHANILIAGSTGAGKTSLLASLLQALPVSERLVCIEDSPELPDLGAHQLRLLARNGQCLRSLVRLALRLRPDRLVIGEVRGAEAFDLLQAMSTGHGGSLATVHADSPAGALARLEQLVLLAGLDWPLEAVRTQITQLIDVVVQVSRGADGRRITAVTRLSGWDRGAYRLTALT